MTFIYTSLQYLTLIGNPESLLVYLIETLQKNIHLSGTNACLCPELTLFLGKTKKTFPMQKTNLEDSFINLIGHINRGRQVFISKIYFLHNFNLFKNMIFPQFLPIFRAKFAQKTQNNFSHKKKF